MKSWQQIKHLAPTSKQMEIIRKGVQFFKVTVTTPATMEEAARVIYKFERMH